MSEVYFGLRPDDVYDARGAPFRPSFTVGHGVAHVSMTTTLHRSINARSCTELALITSLPPVRMSTTPPSRLPMLALQYTQFCGSINIVALDVPQPGDDDCVIKVIAAGLCRSDWHGWQGHDPDISSFPHTPGHEFAGEVHAVGRYRYAFMDALMIRHHVLSHLI